MAVKTKQDAQDDDGILGVLVSRILLPLAYYLLLTPIAWLTKLLGKVWMPLKTDPDRPSYWNQRSRKPASTTSYERQS